MNASFWTLLIAMIALCSCATEPKVGGYSKVSVTQPEVKAAAEFAVAAQSEAKLELVKVLRAEQQVVAGMNYKLTLSVKDDGKSKTVEAIVWEQPWRKPNRYQLTSWK
jgi:hypothetical protein